MQRKLFLIFFTISLVTSASAQSFTTIDQSLIWGGVTVGKKLGNDWKLSLQVEERRYLHHFRAQQRIQPHVGLSKKLNEDWSFSGGIWIFSIYGPADADLDVSRETHEWRLYLSALYNLNERWAVKLQSELRTFMEAGADDHFDGHLRDENFLRKRFKVIYNQPLTDDLKLILSEELHLDVASTSGESFRNFNQNRVVAKFNYKLSPAVAVTLGYLHWFQPTRRDGEYFSRHILLTGLSLTLK